MAVYSAAVHFLAMTAGVCSVQLTCVSSLEVNASDYFLFAVGLAKWNSNGKSQHFHVL